MESKKLIVTASPHITNHTSTRGLMLNVCIALLPALVASTLTVSYTHLTLPTKRIV